MVPPMTLTLENVIFFQGFPNKGGNSCHSKLDMSEMLESVPEDTRSLRLHFGLFVVSPPPPPLHYPLASACCGLCCHGVSVHTSIH